MHVLILVSLGLAATAVLGGEDDCGRERIYTLAIEHKWGAYTFADEEGDYQGFSEEVARLVCAAAGVRCEIIYDTWPNCIDKTPGGHAVLGDGLKNMYFDACVGVFPTKERIHFTKFSEPYALDGRLSIIKLNNTPEITDFTGKKIGFVKGWSINEKCVNNMYKGSPGVPLDIGQIKYYDSPDDRVPALTSGEIDGFISTPSSYVEAFDAGLVEESQKDLSGCLLGQVSVAERRDGQFTDIWNRGFAKILLNGQYRELCDKWGPENRLDAEEGYVRCVTSYNISDFRVNTPWL
jgi:ABC-type amino acid transport substrate-binding protein